MKRKDWYTLIGAVIFTVVVFFGNMAVAQAHDGPEMVQYFMELKAQKDKGKKIYPIYMIASR